MIVRKVDLVKNRKMELCYGMMILGEETKKTTVSDAHHTSLKPIPKATHPKDSGKCFLQGSRRNKKAGAVILRLASSRSVLLMDGKAIVAAIVFSIAHHIGSF